MLAFFLQLTLAVVTHGTLNNTTTNLLSGDQTVAQGINNTTANAAATLGWTIFNGFNVQLHIKS